MEPIVSEITKTRETLEALSVSINKSQDDVNVIMDSLDHIIAEHIQTYKMESIGMMAGGIAHDFHNFIHIIALNTDKIKVQSQDEKVINRCEQILDVCYRASDLVHNIFTLAHSGQVETQKRIDLNEELKKAVALLNGGLPENIRFETALSRDLPPLIGDPVQICQVITNLVNNAKDAINGDGHIKVETEKVILDARDCRGHGNARPGNFVTLTVSDSGSGIPQNLITRIFDPFFSTKKGEKHAGFGLATVYAIVRKHQGWIDVVSEEEKGSCFTLYFPVC